MKLIGSYTSPFVRKISILLLEKGITFEFVNELPYNADSGVARYNPLGKVPALVTDEGEYWFDSPIIAEYIELLDIAPAMLPREPLAALKVRQLEALADGIMDAGLVSVREQARPAAQQSETELLRQREKITRSLDMLEGYLADGTLKTDTVNLATIAIACAVGYLNFRRSRPAGVLIARAWSNWWKRSFNAKVLPVQNRQRLDAHLHFILQAASLLAAFLRPSYVLFVRSWGLILLPPRCILNDFVYVCPPEQSHGTILPISISLSTVERATNSQALS